jgi:hypothetical protein
MTKPAFKPIKSQPKNWLPIIKTQLEKQARLYDAQLVMAKK